MASFTNKTKNSTSLSNGSKNSTSFTNLAQAIIISTLWSSVNLPWLATYYPWADETYNNSVDFTNLSKN